MLPEGFTIKIVAESGKRPLPHKNFLWHSAPDGGATFKSKDNGWIYVSNSERYFGGVSALEFNTQGILIDAYSICSGTHMNCAGGSIEGMKWFILQSKLGEEIDDRDRALELIDRGREILDYDEQILSKIDKNVQLWIDENWK